MFLSIVCLGGIINSCNEVDTPNIDESVGLTKEAQVLKELYKVEIPKMEELIVSRAENNLTEEEAKKFLATFSSQTVSMLKSYGFTEKDWEEFDSTNDPAFIISGMLFLAVAESSIQPTSLPLVKSRTVENNENVDSCVTLERISLCLATAAFGKQIMDILSKEFMGVTCITKALFWATVKRAVTNANLVIAMVSFAVEFAMCVGWN